MKKIIVLCLLILMAGCIGRTVVLEIPSPTTTITTSTTTSTSSTTLSQNQLMRMRGITTSTIATIISTTITTTTTSTTYKLKHQGNMSSNKASTTTTSTTLPKIRPDWLECHSNNDCMIIDAYCCPCDLGGDVITLNKLFMKQYKGSFLCPLSIKCGWMKKPCWYRAICQNNICQKTLESKPAE